MTLHRSFSGIPLGRLEGAGHRAGGGGRSREDSASNSSRTGGLCVSFVADTWQSSQGPGPASWTQPHAHPLFSLLAPFLPLVHGPEGSGSSLPRKPPQPTSKPWTMRLPGSPPQKAPWYHCLGSVPRHPLSPGLLLAASAFFHNGIQGVQDSLQVPLRFDVRDLLLKGEEEAERCPQARAETRETANSAARPEPAQRCCVLRHPPAHM